MNTLKVVLLWSLVLAIPNVFSFNVSPINLAFINSAIEFYMNPQLENYNIVERGFSIQHYAKKNWWFLSYDDLSTILWDAAQDTTHQEFLNSFKITPGMQLTEAEKYYFQLLELQKFNNNWDETNPIIVINRNIYKAALMTRNPTLIKCVGTLKLYSNPPLALDEKLALLTHYIG